MSEQLREKLQAAELVILRETKLRVGETSSFYVDVKKAFGDPELLWHIANAMNEGIDNRSTCIAAAGYGGISLAAAMSLQSGLPLTMVREAQKDHGLQELFAGYSPSASDKVTVVDDVFTTGSSLRQTIESLAQTGALVTEAQVVVKRGEGDLSVPLHFLFEVQQLLE